MFGLVKRFAHTAVRSLGYDIVPRGHDTAPPGPRTELPDFDEGTTALWESVRPYTMTSKERIFALKQSVDYIVKHDIGGDIVECGVWKGGSMMAVAMILRELGVSDRKLYLFDTFEGMPPPAAIDRACTGEAAADILAASNKHTSNVWAYSSLEDVRQTLRSTGYDEGQLFFVKGRVEETLPLNAPERIALLRLDTDWYESTYHELVHLYPRLSVGGVLLIDDYGHWEGAKKAVDRYINENKVKVLLSRIDYTGRMCVKLEP